ncbi:MAG: tetratricopeptide repeat protein [Gemmatimonadota bacterium]|jgi:TolB-like protein
MPTPSLLQRLKERKLVQWALAYLCGAWVLVEAASLVVDQFSWPPIVSQVVTILAFFGFFVVLVIAWYHGEKGRQWVSGPELLIIALLLLISGGVLSILGTGEEEPEQFEPSGSVAMGDDRPSVAILPCDNLSADPADAFLAPALHDEILLKLQGISSVFSTGRATVAWYAENPAPLSQTAQELGVGFVGECSVQRSGDRIRLIFQLLDGRTGGQVWADDYQRELTAGNLFDIQSDIAQQVASAMRAVLTPEEVARLASAPTENTEAYEEYLRGRFHWSTRSPQALELAAEHFRRAIAVDSAFAHAYSGLADSYAVLPFYSPEGSPDEMFRLGEEAAQQAVRLAPDLAEAHASLGYLRLVSRRDWEGAERELRQAIELDPSYPSAHHWLSDLLAFSEKSEESIIQEQAALELDPLSFISNFTLGHRYYWSRRYDQAIRQYEKVVELHPFNYLGWAGLSEVLFLSDSVDYAVRSRSRADELFGTDPGVSETFNRMASEFHRNGIPGTFPPAFDTISNWSVLIKANSAMLVGDTLKALAFLEQAALDNRPDLLIVRVSPLWDPLRHNPRFQGILAQYAGDVGH